MHRVALGWLTWELTESGFWLGAVAFADLFPALIIGPFAGVWADRFDRVRLLRYTQIVSGLLAMLLYILVYFDQANVYLLLVIALALGISASVAQPARLALIPALVKPEDISSAVALGSVIFNTARFLGPMISAAIIASLDVSYAFLFNTLTYLIMIYALFTIPVGLHKTNDQRDRHILGEIFDGFAYTFANPTIRFSILVILGVATLGKPVAELLPGFADAVFDMGPVGLALMTQAMGVGALTGGIMLARFSTRKQLLPLTLFSFFMTGLLIAGFGLTHNFYVGLGILFLASMAMSCAGICTQTITQQAVREDMRGRVMSTWGLIFRGSPAIGVIIMGTASEFSSLNTVVFIGGVICLAASLLLFFNRPKSIPNVAGTSEL